MIAALATFVFCLAVGLGVVMAIAGIVVLVACWNLKPSDGEEGSDE